VSLLVCSAGLDAEDLVADLHEGEQVDLLWDVTLLSLSEVILRVCQSLQGYINKYGG
jgi:hypothetical protein